MTEPLTTRTRIIGKMLIDWCMEKDSQNEFIHFEKSLCDGMQNIRFTSDNTNAVFAQNKYEDGYVLCYELCNTSKNTLLTVKIYTKHISRRQEKLLEKEREKRERRIMKSY